MVQLITKNQVIIDEVTSDLEPESAIWFRLPYFGEKILQLTKIYCKNDINIKFTLLCDTAKFSYKSEVKTPFFNNDGQNKLIIIKK